MMLQKLKKIDFSEIGVLCIIIPRPDGHMAPVLAFHRGIENGKKNTIYAILEGLRKVEDFKDVQDIKLSWPDLTLFDYSDEMPNVPDGYSFYVNHVKMNDVWIQLMHPDSMEERKCDFCFEDADKKCGCCLSVRYCSTKCQTLAWKQHKISCGRE
jgi:hypothetical protein